MLAGKLDGIMLRILVADKLEKSALDGLKELGTDVVSEPELEGDSLEQRIKDLKPAILIVRSTKVTAPMIKGSSIKIIIRAGAGTNTIDVKAASENGTAVTNCPGMNSVAVAELAFGLIIALDRFIPDNVTDVRGGIWNKKKYSKAKGLAGQTLGLFGLGSIGKEMAVRAHAFGMNVISHSLTVHPEARKMHIEMVEVDELAERSDIVSLHTALTDQTRGIIGKAFFEKMRPGALLINTSRAEVIDQTALLEAVQSKGIRAGLDVFEGEPTTAEGTYSGPLCSANGVYCTHHIGASTNQAQEAVASEVVRIVRFYAESGDIINRVN